ncbi:hypothetical protein CEXT_33761 [Caerostris extrusa]|uniref:Uncharacterized protein n=1 Tax=Caerostris extrusa TaxID=172846 RepID=A0AAV4UCD6_CAEEX|nr:hypothetical protein CEXT_33761 [Caerostris extrusa]
MLQFDIFYVGNSSRSFVTIQNENEYRRQFESTVSGPDYICGRRKSFCWLSTKGKPAELSRNGIGTMDECATLYSESSEENTDNSRLPPIYYGPSTSTELHIRKFKWKKF